MERNYQEEELYKTAQKQVKEIKGFYIHLLVYILVNIFIFVANSDFFDHGFGTISIGNLALPFFWGIGVFAHWASVFGPNIFLGKKWEEKKIKELMEKDKERQQKWK